MVEVLQTVLGFVRALLGYLGAILRILQSLEAAVAAFLADWQRASGDKPTPQQPTRRPGPASLKVVDAEVERAEKQGDNGAATIANRRGGARGGEGAIRGETGQATAGEGASRPEVGGSGIGSEESEGGTEKEKELA